MDQSSPLISVIIPVYNMALYLDRCLNSVLSNTYHNLEVLCIDDGSTDESAEILGRYEASDSRVVVIPKRNGGVSSARNVGLDHMTGEFVTFIDADDYIHPRYFELMLQAQGQTHSEFVIGQFRRVTTDSHPGEYEQLDLDFNDIKEVSCEELFRNADYRRYCTIRLIRSFRIGDLRFREDMRYGEDTTFIAELWEKNPKMTACAISLPVYYYFEREGSASQTAEEGKKLCMLRLFAKKVSLSRRNEVIYLDHVIRFSLSNRDLVRYIYPDRDSEDAYNALLCDQIKNLFRTSIYSCWEKLAMLIFILFPGLHWTYRTMRDPSLKRWQIIQKRRREEEKRNCLTH